MGKIRYILPIMFALVIVLAPSANAAKLEVIDQKQEDTTYDWNIILANEPCGQEFTPTMTPLIAVEVYLKAVNPSGADTITVNIRQDKIDGTILGTASKLVDFNLGWVRFDFDPIIALTPGSLYVIEVDATKNTYAWYFSKDVYAYGKGIVKGAQQSGLDWTFRTYSLKEAPPRYVGGEVYSANKIAVLSPYLAFIGIVAIAAAVVKRKLA